MLKLTYTIGLTGKRLTNEQMKSDSSPKVSCTMRHVSGREGLMRAELL